LILINHQIISYLWVLPGYTNLVWIYAFCNLHDFTWGSRGADLPAALPRVTPVSVVADASGLVTVPTPANDYDQHLKILQQPEDPYATEARSNKLSFSLGEHSRLIRTRVLLLWITSNAIMVVTVFCIPVLSTFNMTMGKTKSPVWVGVVLWSNVSLLAAQYFGMVIFYTTRSLHRWIRKTPENKWG
jgi:chitin synthase